MKLRTQQLGLGMWGWFLVLGIIGFAAIVVMNVVPLYLNEMKVYKAVGTTAKNSGGQPLPVMRRDMQKLFDVDAIDQPTVNDIKVVKTGVGKLFGPGTSTADLVDYIKQWFSERQRQEA